MHHEPTPPEEIPAIPRGWLWASLLLPPGITVLVTVTDKGTDGLMGLPVGLIAIIICQFFFIRALRVRYRGGSVALLGMGFFIGQIVICLAVWFGGCDLNQRIY